MRRSERSRRPERARRRPGRTAARLRHDLARRPRTRSAPRRYGRSLVIASSASATAKIRAAERDLRRRRARRDSRVPSQRSWCERTTSSPSPCRNGDAARASARRAPCASASAAARRRSAARASAGSGPGSRSCRRRGAGSRTRRSRRRRPRARRRCAQLDRVALHALRVLAGAVSFDSSALASAVTVSW